MNACQYSPAELAQLPDDALLDAVQRQTFRFFWEGGHAASGMAHDRLRTSAEPPVDLVAIAGTGFGVMSIIVAVERRWITREAAVERLKRIVLLLNRATCYHGAWPHFMHGASGATLPFMRKDDGGDLVETSLLLMGLLCVREYFARDTPDESLLRGVISGLWSDMEWDWYTQNGREVLYWHWSPTNGWAMNLEIRGWNECLISYVLAASSPRHAVSADLYHRGYAMGREFLNGRKYYDIELPLGAPFGGPLYFAHYSFCAIDPRGLTDRYADYWTQNVNHVRINHEHCKRNPNSYIGYGDNCWGLTSSDDVVGYSGHAPDNDSGTIAPTAALSSMPYAPREALQAMRCFLSTYGDKVWGDFGFVDAFNATHSWFADTYLAIDQGPIIVMIENHRSGLLWNLFMGIPEIQKGLRLLGFSSPHLQERNKREY